MKTMVKRHPEILGFVLIFALLTSAAAVAPLPQCVPQIAYSDGITSGSTLSSASANFSFALSLPASYKLWVSKSPNQSDIGIWPITAASANSITAAHSFQPASGVTFGIINPTLPPLQGCRWP